jgi:hypothetical protein
MTPMADPDRSLDAQLRERLESAGCYVEKRSAEGETWFTPHRNRRFRITEPVRTATAANAILREAGMEEAFL